MNIIVDKESLVKDIQKEFNSCYPFLELTFFKKRSTGRALLISEVASEKYLKNLPGFIGPAIIDISSDRTAKDLEEDFKEHVGLAIQVFRKSGNLWIETILTNDWTLERQNKEGEIISRGLYFNKEGF
jgi:hypothetical protein